MSQKWFYYTSDGKMGPITPGEIKKLASEGFIQPHTIIESTAGIKALAKKVSGIKFGQPKSNNHHFNTSENNPFIQKHVPVSTPPSIAPVPPGVPRYENQVYEYQDNFYGNSQPGYSKNSAKNQANEIFKGAVFGIGSTLGSCGCLTLIFMLCIGGCIAVLRTGVNSLENAQREYEAEQQRIEAAKTPEQRKAEQRKREAEQREREAKAAEAAEKKAAEEAAEITMEKYMKIKTGMTFDEVIEILGYPDEILSEVEIAGIHTVMLNWKSKKFLSVGNMNVTIQNGRVIAKAQFGL